jgi:hypothetical protein
MYCGLPFDSSNILKIYSDKILRNNKFIEPKNNINTKWRIFLNKID